MKSLKYKIIFYTIIPLSFVIFGIGFISINNKKTNENNLLLERLSSYRYLLESGDLNFETSANKDKLKALLGEKIEFSEILKEDLSVLYSSENSASPLFKEEDKEDISDAFNGIETIKYKKIEGKSVLVSISPLIVNEKIVAIIHQGISNEEANLRIKNYTWFIFSIDILGLIISFITIFLSLNSVVLKNIFKLKNTVLEIEKGNLNIKTDIKEQDEIGQLSNAFNSMTEKLKNSYNVLEQKVKERTIELEKERQSLEDRVKKRTYELEELKNNLEISVEERTKNLNDKIEELSRINKLMINREIKMIELKKEVEELKNNNKFK